MLARENRVIVSKSIAVEKSRVTLGTPITALFCDLSTDKEPKIPKQGELRERELRNWVRERKKPIVLMVDEAHDLHHHTLIGLKRLIEMVADSGSKPSVRKRRGGGTSGFGGRIGVERDYCGWRWMRLTRCL